MQSSGLIRGVLQAAFCAWLASVFVVRLPTVETVGCIPRPVPPGPTPEPGKLGLAKVSRDGAAGVNPSVRAAQGPALAAKQRSLAGIIRAGGLAQPAEILTEWRAGNNAAATAAAWKTWADAVSAGLESAHKANRLTTPAAWADAFDEIATGLGG